MPSDITPDERTSGALGVLAKAREVYHSALVATAEEVRSMLASRSVTAEAHAERTAAELGAFAVGHIDIDRFASLQTTGEPIPEYEAPRLEAAARTLQALVESGDELHVVRVESGASLGEAVAAALGLAGRAFGAARTVELARAGKYDEAKHASWLDSFAPGLWSQRERELAPPLVVEVEGSDLRTGGLADFLDGSQKIVLVVRGEAPPAALAGLITPGVMVLQTGDPEELSVIVGAPGPVVAALVPGESCSFLHAPDPAGGRGRLTVSHMVESEPRRALGGISAFRQAEDLRRLEVLTAGWGLAASPPPHPSADGGAQAVNGETAADKLAAWILRQSDLPGMG
jgi:hypothetical protein